jgi:hypothetical protein
MRTRTVAGLTAILFCLSLLCMRAAEEASPEPPADVTWTSAGTKAETLSSPKGPLVRLTVPRIRGQGTLTFKEGTPRQFTIRMMRQNAMQSITLTDGTYTLSGQVHGAGTKSVTRWDKGGRTAPLGRPAVTLTVEASKDGGHIDVHVACDKDVELKKEIRCEWTRYYAKDKAKKG